MNYLLFPLRYLRLLSESGRLLVWRDACGLFVVVFLLSTPFIIVGDANFFGVSGLVDRVGGLAATLTGFYVAALVAAATFPTSLGSLDKPIEIGSIKLKKKHEEGLYTLNRRQYVCTMFGYLSFLSLFLSITSISFVVLSSPISSISDIFLSKNGSVEELAIFLFRSATIIFYCLIIAHLIITTCHGLYYLVERLYAREPVIDPVHDPVSKTRDDNVDPLA